MKKLGLKRLIISILLTTGIVALFSDFYVNIDGIKVEFYAKGDKEVDFKIKYAKNEKDRFKGKNSVAAITDLTKTDKVEVVLPTTKMVKMMIDLGRNPGKISFQDLKVDGKKIPFENLKFENIGNHETKDGILTINTGAVFSNIVFENPIIASSQMHFDIKIFVILLTLVFLTMYKTVRYLSVFKIRDKSSRIDIVFVSVFLFLLFVPMSDIDNSDVSVKENRTLAKYYPLFVKGKINNNFGKNFESFFNDRFFLRRHFIRIHDKLIGKINFSRGNDKALIGLDGWYFYKPDDSIKLFQNNIEFYEKELKMMADYLNKFNDWCEKHGKKFYYFIGPDKNKIYGEHIPYIKKVNPDSESRTYKMIRYLKEHAPNVKIIYPDSELIANKDKGLLYYKGDTHWNQLGGYYGYLSLIEGIKKDFKDIIPVEAEGFTENTEEAFDIAKFYYDELPKELVDEKYKTPVLKEKYSCKQEGGGTGDVICENANGKYSLAILRDSFSGQMQNYFGATFKKVRMFWHYGVTTSDLDYIKDNADIVVLENVERLTSLVVGQVFPKLENKDQK